MSNQLFADPGSLNHRVSLLASTELPDGCGGLITTWQVIADVWAKLEPNREIVSQEAQQSRETISHRITIRFRQDVASGWRIHLGSRRFDILTVHDPDERRRYLVCKTREEGR